VSTPTTRTSAANEFDAAGHARCRLLLVEDHLPTRDMLVRLLASEYDVAVAQCYDSGLAAAEAKPPQIVVTDVGLPGGRDGITLMRELKRRHDIPGIAVTGYVFDDTRLLKDAGFVAWLRKPIKFDDLLKAIHGACGVASV
jgi:CheY-like chemotaxis protein